MHAVRRSPAAVARELFERLPGVWAISRSIVDDRLGDGGFAGEGVFVRRQNGALNYEERGTLRLGGWEGPAWRRWIYALQGDGLSIRYADTGSELHHFVFEAAQAHHRHVCGNDTYAATFVVLSGGTFSLAYNVSGPAKSYRSETRFRALTG